MDEPRLELSVEEWEWVRYRKGYALSVVEASIMLDLLLRVEAGRQKLIWESWHSTTEMHIQSCGALSNHGYERHSWTARDWLAAVRREKLE